MSIIVGIFEDRNGVRYVEIHKDADGFRFKFPQDNYPGNIDLKDMKDITVPFERLEQLKTALEDVIWQKGRSTAIPSSNS